MIVFGATKVAYPLFKAATLGAITYGVIGNRGLSVTERALIVALVAGFLGIVQVVIGQVIAGHFAERAALENRKILERLEEMQVAQTAQLSTINRQTNGENEPC